MDKRKQQKNLVHTYTDIQFIYSVAQPPKELSGTEE